MCEPTVIVHSAIFLGVWAKLMGAICFGNVPGTCCGLETTRRGTRNVFAHWRFYDAHHPTHSRSIRDVCRVLGTLNVAFDALLPTASSSQCRQQGRAIASQIRKGERS